MDGGIGITDIGSKLKATCIKATWIAHPPTYSTTNHVVKKNIYIVSLKR